MKKEIIIICGPTASGKSYLAHHLAKAYDGEIVNIDSMQVYKEIPIITASPSKDYKAKIPHYLYNFLPITEEFSVIKYLQLAAEKIREISKRNKLIILVGGTGLYVNSLLFGYNQIPEISQNLRQYVRDLQNKLDKVEFFEQLKNLDPLSASKLNSNDTQRLARAYEVFLQTGKSIFFFQSLPKSSTLSEFNFKVIFLCPERTFLYKTCNDRLEKIFKEGAIAEIALLNKNFQDLNSSAMKAVGVSEILAYLNGNITLDEALILAQNKTRQYAKRQITWFKNQIEEKITVEYANEEEFFKLLSKFRDDVIPGL